MKMKVLLLTRGVFRTSDWFHQSHFWIYMYRYQKVHRSLNRTLISRYHDSRFSESEVLAHANGKTIFLMKYCQKEDARDHLKKLAWFESLILLQISVFHWNYEENSIETTSCCANFFKRSLERWQKNFRLKTSSGREQSILCSDSSVSFLWASYEVHRLLRETWKSFTSSHNRYWSSSWPLESRWFRNSIRLKSERHNQQAFFRVCILKVCVSYSWEPKMVASDSEWNLMIN